MNRTSHLLPKTWPVLGWLLLFIAAMGYGQTSIQSRLTLADPDIEDQDDMCIWVHPTDRALSTIITSDKAANKLFVYDLQGNTVQKISLDHKPGNIDIRYNFPLGGQKIDIVAYNDRSNNKIKIYRVDPVTRQLSRVDDDQINTPSNYGMCLYRSPVTGKFYAFTTAKNGTIAQIELFENNGLISGIQVRQWDIGGQTEGCVCDDETGQAYFGEEEEAIWKVGAEPGDPTSGTKVAQINDGSGLKADVEGLTIYYAAGGGGYLIASSQGSDQFIVYERQPPHTPLGIFEISGVEATDGIDVMNMSLGPDFPFGIFTAHNGRSAPYPVEVCAFQDIGLPTDTSYWDPRKGPVSTGVEASWSNLSPDEFQLLPNFPNPFNPITHIPYQVPSTAHVRLEVYDPLGRPVRVLVDRLHAPGTYLVPFEASALPSGIYYYRLQAGTTSKVRKMLLAR